MNPRTSPLRPVELTDPIWTSHLALALRQGERATRTLVTGSTFPAAFRLNDAPTARLCWMREQLLTHFAAPGHPRPGAAGRADHRAASSVSARRRRRGRARGDRPPADQRGACPMSRGQGTRVGNGHVTLHPPTASKAAEVSGWRDGAGRVYRTDPALADTDADGLSDGDEAGLFTTNGAFGTGKYYKGFSDPTKPDTDGDELGDAQELDLETHPRLKDSDMDTLRDLAEVGAGFDPLTFNADEDYKFDDQEVVDGTDPFGYDFDGLGNVHAAISGFWFGDAWDSAAAGWAQVNINVASSPWYLVGQAASGFVVIGDLRDLLYGAGTGNWGNAAWAAVGVIPFAGDAVKVVRETVQFAAKSTRAVRAAVEFASRNLPKRYADDVIETIAKLAKSRLPRDLDVLGRRAPRANYDITRGAWTTPRAAKISNDSVQARQLQDKLDELREIWLSDRTRVSDVRVNQRQVTGTEQLGINRPDLQYTLDGKRYYVEWDKPRCSDPTTSLRGDLHAERIFANDPTIDYATQVVLLIAGACE